MASACILTTLSLMKSEDFLFFSELGYMFYKLLYLCVCSGNRKGSLCISSVPYSLSSRNKFPIFLWTLQIDCLTHSHGIWSSVDPKWCSFLFSPHLPLKKKKIVIFSHKITWRSALRTRSLTSIGWFFPPGSRAYELCQRQPTWTEQYPSPSPGWSQTSPKCPPCL